MSLGHVSPMRRLAAVGLLASLAIVGTSWDADARPRKNSKPRAIHGPSYRPPYAAIVVDDKSGRVLHEASADDPRHPASLTKIMTLYLLFEQIEAGKLKLDTPLPVSAQAAIQRPTKLGLKAGQTIKVEDAIMGLVTKSANDAAVVVGEAIGGTEADFAKLMTLKARMLGMTSTVYVNSSGLPAEEQITTARDQAILGRAIQHRFPRYYRYFATPSFQYRGREMRNHNGLLGNVRGVDGIKTGYTDASGYNLVSSVRRDEKHIVAVVLGGTSNSARDARMRQLIEEHISQASLQRTAPIVVETAVPDTPTLAAITPATPTPSPAVLTAASVEAASKVEPASQVEPAAKAEPAATSAAADQAQVPMPRAKPAKSTPVAEHPPRRARHARTNTAATVNARAAAPSSAATQPRHVERSVGGSAPPE
jgi:D-alanyl-D-alanine carboxypeptidase